MPNAAQHGAIGAAAGAATYLGMSKFYNRPVDLGELLLCAGAATLAAALPDLFEPAFCPNHRQFAHSITAIGLLAKFAYEKCGRKCEWEAFQKIFWACIVAGYVSHLVADALTPRGLPVVGKILVGA